jgi:hypothetical protein
MCKSGPPRGIFCHFWRPYKEGDNQELLKERLRDSISEAWKWEEQRIESGTELRIRDTGWLGYTPEEVAKDPHGSWTLEALLELVNFVVDNGFVERGGVILRQVKGFGMGLACAPQIANLGCYPVERDFAAGRKPAEMEHNYRFIDDILSLTGYIPTEQEYGMQYKTTGKATSGKMVYLGMEMVWEEYKGKVKFVTGMHFRDAEYPIRIRRYPAQGSMITDSQRMGVITGQFIRAQRLCSVLSTFKAGVQGVILAAMRRGYKRGEVDRMWGKFLVQWWKAEEVRRGELRSWFRKMTVAVSRQVWNESRAMGCPMNPNDLCRFGKSCKRTECQFSHPKWVPCRWEELDNTVVTPTDLGVAFMQHETNNIAKGPKAKEAGAGEVARETIRKDEGWVWDAPRDGSCLFHSVLGREDMSGVARLRCSLTQIVLKRWKDRIPGLEETIEGLFSRVGVNKLAFIQSVRNTDYWGGELELVLLAWITGTRLRVFHAKGDTWEEYAQYGATGHLRRLVFDPAHKHYGVIWLNGEQVEQAISGERPVEARGYRETFEEINVDVIEDEAGNAPMDTSTGGCDDRGSHGGSCSTWEDLVGVAAGGGPRSESLTYAEVIGAEEVKTESDLEQPEKPQTRRRRRGGQYRFSLKRTTTQYSQACGVCGEWHTHKVASALCTCGGYVHLKCLGFSSIRSFEDHEGELDCKCTRRAPSAESARNSRRVERSRSTRRQILVGRARQRTSGGPVSPTEAQTKEGHAQLNAGDYVRLHGLNNQDYNGREGLILSCDTEKAEVEVAGLWKCIKVRCANLTVIPTYRGFRFKRRVEEVRVTGHRDPVALWPEKLAGTHYEILGVPVGVDAATLKVAYNKLSVQVHPDKNPGHAEKATALFKQVNEAFNCLKNDDSRRRYNINNNIHVGNWNATVAPASQGRGGPRGFWHQR